MTQGHKDHTTEYPIDSIKHDTALDVFPLISYAANRAGIVESIKTKGVLKPLLVRREGDNLIIIDGRNRLAIARELGLQTVPCRVIATDAPREIALDMALHQRQMSKTAAAYFVILAHPELRNRADQGGKPKANCQDLSVSGASGKYGVSRQYLAFILAVLEECRPKSKDEERVCHMIMNLEVAAENLMKALKGWQVTNAAWEKNVDPAKAPVDKKLPVNLIRGMKRSFTFIRCQTALYDGFDARTKAVVMEQWKRTWRLLPEPLQQYALKEAGKTTDYAAAREAEAELRKPRKIDGKRERTQS